MDGLFYLNKLHLVAAAWIVVVKDKQGTLGDFIISVPIEYSYPYIAELYRVLSFIVFIDHMLIKYLSSLKDTHIEVGSDC